MKPNIRELVATQQVIVCCGAGGVGKTTVATGLALAGARSGKRVLALTIDPSRRLADTLGVSRNLKAPVTLPEARLREVGIVPPGRLDAWMLDPQLIADQTIRRLTPSAEAAERLMSNRIYHHTSDLIAGLLEYTAMEALHGFLTREAYDLIVLDTPPSRNALDFLEGPGRLERFFDGQIFRLFLPPAGEQGFMRRAASAIVGKVLTAVFGEETYGDLVEYFHSFSDIFNLLSRNAQDMRDRLMNPQDVSFLMITSPAGESLTEAFFFKQKTDSMGLPFRGFVLNRSQATGTRRHFPSEIPLEGWAPPALVSAMGRLERFAAREQAQEQRDLELLEQLRTEAGEGAFAVALPTLTGGADDLPSLVAIAEALVKAGEAPEVPDGPDLELHTLVRFLRSAAASSPA